MKWFSDFLDWLFLEDVDPVTKALFGVMAVCGVLAVASLAGIILVGLTQY